MFKRWLSRWADRSLALSVHRQQEEIDRLTIKLKQAESQLQIQQLEIDQLSAVVVRNTKRVEAETAAAVREIAGK